jgi:hypothetical protein
MRPFLSDLYSRVMRAGGIQIERDIPARRSSVYKGKASLVEPMPVPAHATQAEFNLRSIKPYSVQSGAGFAGQIGDDINRQLVDQKRRPG